MEILKNELEAGRAVILPTETVYGLFAKALDQDAVDLVYRLKQRPRDKAMNLNIANLDQVTEYADEIPPYFQDLVAHFWPGPLTILLKAGDNVPYKYAIARSSEIAETTITSDFSFSLKLKIAACCTSSAVHTTP